MWVRARAASSNLKEAVSSVPAWFRADSGTNLVKQIYIYVVHDVLCVSP